MKLTKFCHSCILVETEPRVGLFDPGSFAWESGLVDLSNIERIDRVIITHAHEDHCHLPFIKEIQNRFPEVHIIANNEVQNKLRAAGISMVMRDESQCSRAFDAPHEVLPFGDAPQNTGYNFLQTITHPGDSLSFKQTCTILALPYVAPWGSTNEALKLAIELSPKFVLPIHDWHLNADARSWYYEMMDVFFQQHGIQFLALKDGQSTNL